MQYAVFRLFAHGRPANTEYAANRPAQGELILSPQIHDVSGKLMAQLMHADERYVIPMLVNARVVAIERDAMVIVGTEQIPRAPTLKSVIYSYPQKWVCVPPDKIKPPEGGLA